MARETPLRRVQFSIDSSAISIEHMTSELKLTADRTVSVGQVPSGSVLCRPSTRNTWEIVESGDDSSDVNQMLRRIYERLNPVREEILSLRKSGCIVMVSIIQYVSATDRVGPGFSLDFAMIEFMFFVGAELDVDQYVIE